MRIRINYPKQKTNYLLLFFIISLVFINSCSRGNEPEDKNKGFSISLLEDQAITWEDMKNRKLDSLKLKDWITGDKIDFYDYSSHVIYLNVDYKTLFSVPHKDNTPFVVVANNKRCYYGLFNQPQDTTQPHVLIKPLEACSDMVMLEFNPANRKDIRLNESVKNALIDANIYKSGLTEVWFTSLKAFPDLKPPYIEFYFTVKNKENENIYYVGYPWWSIKVNNIFYKTKTVFYNKNSFFSVPASVYSGEPDTVDVKTMHYKVSFSSITPKSTGYFVWHDIFPMTGIPTGNYNCFIEYYGMMGGAKEKRETPDGRIWIGYLRTNTINLDYDNKKGVEIKNLNVTLD